MRDFEPVILGIIIGLLIHLVSQNWEISSKVRKIEANIEATR